MTATQDRTRIRRSLDAYTRFCLAAIVGLLALIALGVWSQIPTTPGATAAPPPARLVLPDTSAQMNDLIAEQRLTNAKLDQIQRTLAGELKVRLSDAENKPEGPRNVPAAGN